MVVDTQIRDEWKLEIVCEVDDKLSPLDVDVARGIRHASELPRERYLQPDVEDSLEVVVIYMAAWSSWRAIRLGPEIAKTRISSWISLKTATFASNRTT